MTQRPYRAGFDKAKFALEIKARRGGTPVREAAASIGIAAATLVRLEKCTVTPDVVTFAKVCEWLEIEPTVFTRIDQYTTCKTCGGTGVIYVKR